MKTVLQSLAISLVLHIICILGALAFGYLRTRDDKPEIASRYENFEPLQQEAAMGIAVSPLMLLCTFFGTAAVCGIIIALVKRIRMRKSPTS